jgi:hypothetical protein
MGFSTYGYQELRRKVLNLTFLVGDDTPESVERECGNPTDDEDYDILRYEYFHRMQNIEKLKAASQELIDYENQFSN